MTVKPVLSRPIALAAAGGALALAAAGCGGGSNSSSAASSTTSATSASTPAPALTRAQYLAQANAVCTRSNGPLAATALKLASHPNPVEAVHIIAGTFIPQIKAQLTAIQAIGTPAGGQAAVGTMDRLLAADIARIEKNPALAGPAAFHDFAKVAHAYGLTACAPLS